MLQKMLLGYVRVSTQEQNEERQIRALKERGVLDKYLYIDKQSGKTADRKGLKDMLSFCREDDIIITESISRIARNTTDLLNIVAQITEKGAIFISLKENIDTSTPQGKFMLTVFGAMATLERESILERQREGIQIAKENGAYKGKPKMSIDEEKLRDVAIKWRNGELKAVEAMEIVGLKKNTFYRRIKELGL